MTIVYPTIDFDSSILESDFKPNTLLRIKIPEEREDNEKITGTPRDHPSR